MMTATHRRIWRRSVRRATAFSLVLIQASILVGAVALVGIGGGIELRDAIAAAS